MGHGPLAATVMTRLSAAPTRWRTWTCRGRSHPAAQQDRPRTAQDTLVTCAYAVIDPAGQSCVIAAAGHLPPVLAMPTAPPGPRHARRPVPRGSPASYGQARIRLRPGTILALYTDGLVETRTRPFDQGIFALRSALARPRLDLDATCEELATAPGETAKTTSRSSREDPADLGVDSRLTAMVTRVTSQRPPGR